MRVENARLFEIFAIAGGYYCLSTETCLTGQQRGLHDQRVQHGVKLIAHIKHVQHFHETNAEKNMPALQRGANDNVERQRQQQIERPRARRAVVMKGPDLGYPNPRPRPMPDERITNVENGSLRFFQDIYFFEYVWAKITDDGKIMIALVYRASRDTHAHACTTHLGRIGQQAAALRGVGHPEARVLHREIHNEKGIERPRDRVQRLRETPTNSYDSGNGRVRNSIFK